jgi:hypothetical protein
MTEETKIKNEVVEQDFLTGVCPIDPESLAECQACQ